jgi:hypothetical protein
MASNRGSRRPFEESSSVPYLLIHPAPGDTGVETDLQFDGSYSANLSPSWTPSTSYSPLDIDITDLSVGLSPNGSYLQWDGWSPLLSDGGLPANSDQASTSPSDQGQSDSHFQNQGDEHENSGFGISISPCL